MMTNHTRVEAHERILSEYAGLYGLTQKARAYFAEQGERDAQRQAVGSER